MKRREFIKTTAAAAGVTSIIGSGCSSVKQTSTYSGPGFDIHPFIKNHPEAVFINITDVKSKRQKQQIHDAGFTLAEEIFVKTNSGGYPVTSKIACKPNWTSTQQIDGKPVYDKLGVNTDPYFVEGVLKGIRTKGPDDFYLRECASPNQWEPMGYQAMADRNGINLRDLTSQDYWELKEGKDLNFIKIPDGVMFKEMAFMEPMNEPDTFLVNIAKFKAHGMGITASVKNLQGITGKKFHQFCNRYDSIRNAAAYQRYIKFFHNDFEKRIEENYARHLKEGIPRWDRPGTDGGIWMETWVQRMLDSYSATKTGLNMVEGIYSQDGNGFGVGPHEKTGPGGVSSRDYMSNMVIFGVDAFRVDIVSHWLGGHEPGNFGLFHIGIERGFSDVLDPFDIPVYLWDDGQAVLTRLDNFTRTPLVTYYLQRDYNDQVEPRFHLCDEPFDYSPWKTGAVAAASKPSVNGLGFDKDKNVVIDMFIPNKDNVYVDVLDKKGRILWRLVADDMNPGVHQVVWDGFDQPGIYNVYVKGMGWDTKKQMVVYS
ncbi:DUF362 domain-containing protein [Candidatus Latescibacterota bacterium]